MNASMNRDVSKMTLETNYKNIVQTLYLTLAYEAGAVKYVLDVYHESAAPIECETSRWAFR